MRDYMSLCMYMCLSSGCNCMYEGSLAFSISCSTGVYAGEPVQSGGNHWKREYMQMYMHTFVQLV